MKLKSRSFAKLSLAVCALAPFFSAPQAFAQSTFTWNGGGTDSSLSTGANWGGSAPGGLQNYLHFAGTTRLAPVNGFANWTAFQILFDAGAGAFTLTGNGMNFYDYGGVLPKIENDSTNLQTISLNQLDVEKNMTLYANTGSLAITCPIYLDLNTTLTSQTNSGTTVTFSGAINNGSSSVGALAVTGSGKTILTAVNYFTGGVTLSGGTLGISAGSNLGALGGAGLTFSGTSSLQFQVSGGSNALAVGRNFTLNTGVSATLDTQGFNNTDNGIITGAGALVATGSGTGVLTLTGANTYTGGTTVTAATLQLTGSGTLGGTSGSLAVNGGTLDLNGTTQAVGNFSGTGGTILNNSTGSNVTLTIGTGNGTGGNYQGVLADHTSGTGTLALSKTGSGTITLSGANTYSGGTNLNGGSLALGSSGALGATGTISFGGGTLQSSASNTTDYSGRFSSAAGQAYSIDTNTQTVTLASGLNSSTGTLSVLGGGTLRLAAANGYTGTTTVGAGTLALTGSGSLANGASGSRVNVSSGGVFDISGVTTGTSVSILSETGSGNGGSVKLGAKTLTMNGGAASTMYHFNTLGLAGDTGSLTLNAASASTTLRLYGASLYTGATTIQAGNLQIVSTTATSGYSLTGGNLTTESTANLADTATLAITSGTFTAGASDTIGAISGAGGTIAIGAGLTLTTNTASTTTFSGQITGTSGSLAKVGTGTLVLAGSNTYGGETDLNAGILVVAAATTGTGTSGTYYVGNGGTTGTAATLQLGAAVTLANPITINPGSASNRTLSATNAAATTATYSGSITLNNAAVFTSTTATALLAFAGSNSININSNQLTVNGSGNTTISEVLGSANAAGGYLYKDGTGTLILQNTSNTYTGTSAGFLNGNGTQINAGTLGIYGDGSLGVAPVGPYANLQFLGSATLQDSANNITLDVNRTISVATGATATFDTNGHVLTINGLVSSAGAANVVKIGAGSLIVNSSGGGLANSSTWTAQGGTYNSTTGLYDSVLGIAAGNVLGGSTGNVLNLNAGTLQFTANGGAGYLSTRTINVTSNGGAISDGGFAPGDATSGGSQIAPSIVIASGSGLDLVSSNKLQLWSVISGAGGLAKFGTGTAVLVGTNTYTGTTTIKGGTLQIGNGGTTGALSASGTILNNGTLVFNRSNTVSAGTDYSGSIISGSGSIVQSGSGTLVLWSGNTYTGGVTINSGTVGIWEGSGLGAIPVTPATDLTFAGNGTLRFFQTPSSGALSANRLVAIGAGVTATLDTQSYSPVLNGVISGLTGTLNKVGSGTLTLNGANTYGGGTTVTAGWLQLGNAAALGAATGSLTVNSGGSLNLGGYSSSVGLLTSTSGTFTGFNLGGSLNTLAASSASVSGTHYIGFNPSGIAGAGTSNLITSSAGGLTGTFQFAGAQDLAGSLSSLIVKNGSGTFYRVTLANTGTAEQAVISSGIPSHVMNIMPLGASIMAGYSSQSSYDGGGFHTQLYANLVNDGRFTPNFVGSNTNLYANNPASPNLLSTAGQTNQEGHPGYTTNQILNNLNANDGSAGNNGGYWLAPGNGINPNYVPLNVGGNDFAANHTDTQSINRYDAIVSQVNTLRAGVTTLASNLMYRSDVGSYINTYYNPYVQGVVYNHVLAGQSVQFVDLYNLITPGASLTNLSSDGVHLSQAGYNLMGDIMYHSTVYGAAYWTGNQDGNWNTLNGGTNTNWAMDAARTTDRQKQLTDSTATTYSYADVYFNGNSAPLVTTLGADTTVRSLNFAAGATGSVAVGGSNTLSLGGGGITVQQGTGAHFISANIALTSDQTWGNVSANNLTLSGVVSGSANLNIAGSYTVYTGTSSAAITPQTVSGTGVVVLTGSNTYTGGTTISANGKLQLGSGGTTGSLAAASAIINHGSLTINRSNAAVQGTDFSGAAITGTGSIIQAGSGTTTLNAANTYSGATTVAGGTLKIDTAGTINSSSGVTVAAGSKFVYNSSTALTVGVALTGSAVLGGSGTIGSPVILNNPATTLSPGNSPGTLSFTPAQAWSSFSYDWEINNFTSTVAGTGFDQIAIANSLGLAPDTGTYHLNVLSLTGENVAGAAADFSEINHSWTILTSTGLTGFNAANWTIDTAGFTNPDTGTWALGQTGNDLVLTYTAIPEPDVAMLVGGCGMLVLLRRQRPGDRLTMIRKAGFEATSPSVLASTSSQRNPGI